MYVVAGLGNPGLKYSLTRHNMGFMAIDTIADHYGFLPFKTKFHLHLSEGEIGGFRVILCKPLTYMNLSGHALADLINFYKIPLNHLYVLHDDLDLLPGVMKIKKGGGHGGHNGLKNIDACLGKEYWRLRLGIGHPGSKDAVSDYVLSRFKASDNEWLTDFLSALALEMDSLFRSDPYQWVKQISLRLSSPT